MMNLSKVAERIGLAYETALSGHDKLNAIESILKEVVGEAVKKEVGHALNGAKMAIKAARAKAYRDAAEIAEGPKPHSLDHVECVEDAGKNIASLIRAKSKEVGGGD